MSTTVYLILGSNLGDREKNLNEAYRGLLKIEGLEIVESSPLYLNPAVGMKKSAPDFINVAIEANYKYRPQELLNAIELIEKKMGRTGKGKIEPRTIDIDIALFGDEIIETEQLSIPHRRLTERAFMLGPILHLHPEAVHPVTKEPLASYLKDKDREKLIVFKEQIEVDA